MAGSIGVGDGGSGTAVAPPPKFGQKLFFSGKNHVKFGHFDNFSCIYFRAKMSCPLKLTKLLRLWREGFVEQAGLRFQLEVLTVDVNRLTVMCKMQKSCCSGFHSNHVNNRSTYLTVNYESNITMTVRTTTALPMRTSANTFCAFRLSVR